MVNDFTMLMVKDKFRTQGDIKVTKVGSESVIRIPKEGIFFCKGIQRFPCSVHPDKYKNLFIRNSIYTNHNKSRSFMIVHGITFTGTERISQSSN